MHIAILTGGGDCPGLNAVIRAVSLALIQQCGARVSGVERGFLGLIEQRLRPLALADVRDILAQGGTILGTHNRCDPFHYFAEGGADVSARVLDFVRAQGIDALVAIGGDGTMAIAEQFSRLGLPVVGVPKTIDNDLYLTERSFGFDSAVAVVSEALDRLETTARSHGRVMIAETMGRHAGWIALEGGLAGGADAILLPELPYRLEAVIEHCRRRTEGGGHALICVAEGAHAQAQSQVVRALLADSPDPVRLGGIGALLAQQLQQALGAHSEVEVRSTLLGHVQRGGTPTAFDRVLATQFGWAAAQLVREGRFGRMVALQGAEFTSVALAEVAGRNRLVPLDHPLLQAARGLGLCLGH